MRFALRLALLGSLAALGQDLKPTTPQAEWERVKPEAVGLSPARLEVLRSWLKTQKTTAMMVVYEGRSVFEYGDLSKVTKTASVRKSILAMMYGKYVADGTVNFDRTVKEIGLDDVQPFLPVEAGATLRQLLMARSGIYLDANNHNLSDLNPKRGSQQPGTYFQYQNWDFNAAGTAFEKLTGKNLYDALEADLAKPLGFQDWNRERQKKASSMPESVHPEYPMYLSTRDMARLGLLMLQDGMWNGKRLMPAGWAKQITTLVTRPEEIHPMGAGGSGTASRAGRWGYGTLWWVWDAPLWPNVITGPYQGAYTAMGANGQYITVFPLYDIVVVHKVDIDRDETSEVTPEEYTAVLDMLVASVCPGQCQ